MKKILAKLFAGLMLTSVSSLTSAFEPAEYLANLPETSVTQQANALAQLEKKLAELVAKVARSESGDQRQLKSLQSTIRSLQEQLADVEKLQSGFAQKGQVSAEVKKLLDDQSQKITTDLKGVNVSLQTLEKETNGRLTAVEGTALRQDKILFALVALMVVAVVILWRRTTVVKKEAYRSYTLASQALTLAKEVEGNLEYVSQYIERGLALDIHKKLESDLLALLHGHSHTTVVGINKRTLVLEFTRISDHRVQVEGIGKYSKEVPIKSVVSLIKRAALQGHLVGVVQTEPAKLYAVK